MKKFVKTLLAMAVMSVSYIFVGALAFRGADALVADYRQEVAMQKAVDEFLRLPKSYKESSAERANMLVRDWNSPPSQSQRQLLEKEVAPRVAYLEETNSSEIATKFFNRHKKAIEYYVAKAR